MPYEVAFGQYMEYLTFTANLGHVVTHLWSVSVEFQFYIISPFIVNSMMRTSPYRWPLLLLAISIALNFIINALVCPGMLE